MDRLERLKDYWNAHANSYERRFGLNTGDGLIKVARRADRLFNGLNRNMLVLEVGCGTGVYTRELSHRVKGVIACDLSEGMLYQADKYNNVSYQVADCHNPPVYSYDAIVGAYILQYLDLNLALGNYYRALKHGGCVAFLEPCAINPYVYFATRTRAGKKLLHRPQDTYSFFPFEIINKLRRAGFKNVSVKPTDWHYGSIIIKAVKE